MAGCLAALPAEQATALRLAYIDRLSQPEIARRMGFSVREASATIASALTRLGRMLSADPSATRSQQA